MFTWNYQIKNISLQKPNIMEKWKEVKGYEGFYEVSNYGRVKSVPRYVDTTMNCRHYVSTILTPSHNNAGYSLVNLAKNGKIKTQRIHILVAEAFIPNEDNKPCVDHINGIRDDNRVENLRWCTYKENSNFDLAKQHLTESHKNQTNENLMKVVCQYTKEGELVGEYQSSKDAAEAVGCSRSGITKGCREGIPIKGFIWKYKKETD